MVIYLGPINRASPKIAYETEEYSEAADYVENTNYIETAFLIPRRYM